MRFLLLFLISFNLYAGTGAIPSGPNIKMLKDNIRFKNTDTKIMTNDSDDPTVVAKSAEIGTLYIQGGTGLWFQKQDSGLSTNWQQILIGATGLGTDNRLARWDGTGTPELQNSLAVLDDLGALSGLTQLNVDNLQLDANTMSSTDVNGDIILDPNGTGKIVLSSDVDIIGTMTHVASTALDVTNATILVNDGGTQATADANDAGLIVEMSDATDVQLGYDSTCATRFQSGDVGSLDCTVNETVTQTLTNKTIDADSNTITNIENADIKVGAAIDRAKLASGTANHVLINDGSGVMSSEALLATSRGGTGIDTSASTGFPRIAAGTWSVSAIDLTADVSGILPIANGGTNSSTALNNDRVMVSSGGSIVESSALTDGQLVIGSTGAAPVVAAIGATADQTTVTNGAGSITIGTVQDINTTSSPAFTGLTLSGLTQNRVPFVGVGGVLQDDANFTYVGGVLTVNGQVDVDNLRLNGNALSSTDINGNISLAPNGSGEITMSAPVLVQHETTPAANPSAGTSKYYMKSGDHLFILNSSGVEKRIKRYDEKDSLLNHNFEQSKAANPALGWTNVAGTPTIISTTFNGGSQGLQIALAAQSLDLSQGFNCDDYANSSVGFSAWANTTLSDVKLCSYRGTSQYECATHDGSGDWKRMSVLLPVVSGETCTVRFESGSNTGVVQVDDVQFSTNPLIYKNIVETNSIMLEGNDGRAITANTEDVFFSGTGNGWTSSGNDNYYTVQNDNSVVDLRVNTRTTATGFVALEIYLDTGSGFVRYKNVGRQNATGTTVGVGSYLSEKGEFNRGDKISVRFNTTKTLTNDSVVHFLNIVEQWEAEHVITPARVVDQTTEIFQTATFGLATITGAATNSSGSGLYSYDSGTGIYTVLKPSIVTVGASFRSTTGGGSVVIYRNATSLSRDRDASSTSIMSASVTFKASVGDTFRVDNGIGTIHNQEIVVHARAAEAEFLAAVPVPKVANIEVNASFAKSNLSATTSYKTHPLVSIIDSNSDFLSIDSDQLTLQAGVYSIEVPVGSSGGALWVDFGLYDVNGASYLKEFFECAFSNGNVVSFHTINTTLTLTQQTVVEFRTKADTSSGNEFIGRPKITKLR